MTMNGLCWKYSVEVVSGVFSAYLYQYVTLTHVPKVKAGYSVTLAMFVSVPTTPPLEVLS